MLLLLLLLIGGKASGFVKFLETVFAVELAELEREDPSTLIVDSFLPVCGCAVSDLVLAAGFLVVVDLTLRGDLTFAAVLCGFDAAPSEAFPFVDESFSFALPMATINRQ